MKFLKLLILLSVLLISGCGTEDVQNSELSNNGERLSYNYEYRDSEVPNIVSSSNNDSGNFIDTEITESQNVIPSAENTEVTNTQKETPPELPVDPSLLSSYSTKILTNDSNRYNNIKIVSDKLNGFILAPGEEFSFNNELGPFGKDDGFLEAKILLSNGKEDKGYGGGVCQLSSTLYNAVTKSNLQITEHHNHSTPVAYVPKGQDATVSLQSGLDFKFINNKDYPIRFETSHDPNNLKVEIHRADM